MVWSSVGVFFLVALLLLYLVIITLCILFIPAPAEYQPELYLTLLFPLLYKIAAQKVKMEWNPLMGSSRLGASPVAIPMVLCNLPLFCFARESS
jgi:hypothetical protein